MYSSQSEHLPEAPTCILPRVHCPELCSSIRASKASGQLSFKEKVQKSPEKNQKKSRFRIQYNLYRGTCNTFRNIASACTAIPTGSFD